MPKHLALILACGVGIAACGSASNNNQTRSAAKGYAQAIAFSKCMRAHGLPKFPDPQSSGGGVQLSIGSGTGINPQAPAFQSAQKACRHLLPGGGPGSGHASRQAMAQMLQVSECMRAHGVSGFPDPTTKGPSDPTGYSAVMDRNGAVLAIPNSIDIRSPAFMRAAAACHFGPRGGALPKP
jgi:hypothetical protein